MVRRKGVLILIFTIIYAVLINSSFKQSYLKNRELLLDGTVRYTQTKKYSSEYLIGDTLLVNKKRNQNIKTGDVLEVFGKEEDMNNMRIKDFDYGRYLKSKGIRRVITMKKYRIIGVSIFYEKIGDLRQYIKSTNDYLYKENSGRLNAIVIADKSAIDKKTSYIFMDSGTSHIMAISGLHITIILGIIVLLTGKINSPLKFIAFIFFMELYSELIGNSPSVRRAVDLFIFSYIGFFIDERLDILNVLSFIASFMILQNTYIIYNLSFQLSFISIVSISILSKYLDKIVYGKVLASSLAIIIGTAPLVLYIFKEVSLVSFMANIIAIPFTALIMVFDLISLFSYFFIPGLSYYISFINNACIDFMLLFLKKIGNFGCSNIVVKKIDFKYIIIYYFILISINIFLYIATIRKELYLEEGEKNI